MDTDAIARFWEWWPIVAARLASAGAPVLLAEIDDLARQVDKIHPNIQVLGKSDPNGSSWLCLSSRGNLQVRPLVDRWALGAPPAANWRFLSARPPSWPAKRKTVFPLTDIVTVPDEDNLCEVIHVRLHHPELATLERAHQDALMFTALDHLLGEDAVERWIGDVEVADEAPTNAVPIAELRPIVKDVAARATGERWQAIRAGGKDKPLLVCINRALKPIDSVALPIHARVDLKLQSPTRHGLAQTATADSPGSRKIRRRLHP